MTVSVANQRLSLKTDAKPKYIKELADLVDLKLKEAKKAGRTVTTQSLALLAALREERIVIAELALQETDLEEAFLRIMAGGETASPAVAARPLAEAAP